MNFKQNTLVHVQYLNKLQHLMLTQVHGYLLCLGQTKVFYCCTVCIPLVRFLCISCPHIHNTNQWTMTQPQSLRKFSFDSCHWIRCPIVRLLEESCSDNKCKICVFFLLSLFMTMVTGTNTTQSGQTSFMWTQTLRKTCRYLNCSPFCPKNIDTVV